MLGSAGDAPPLGFHVQGFQSLRCATHTTPRLPPTPPTCRGLAGSNIGPEVENHHSQAKRPWRSPRPGMSLSVQRRGWCPPLPALLCGSAERTFRTQVWNRCLDRISVLLLRPAGNSGRRASKAKAGGLQVLQAERTLRAGLSSHSRPTPLDGHRDQRHPDPWRLLSGLACYLDHHPALSSLTQRHPLT